MWQHAFIGLLGKLLICFAFFFKVLMAGSREQTQYIDDEGITSYLSFIFQL